MLNNLSREQQFILLGLILVVVSGLGVMGFRHFYLGGAGEIVIEEPHAVSIRDDQGIQIIVHVAGAVVQEGVYKIKLGDRIVDALKLAGGTTGSSDLSSINLAEKIKDGQKINVPQKQIVSLAANLAPRSIGSKGFVSSSSKVNINSASEKDLCKVKGIGATTAKRIVEYRSTNGPFSKIEDIMKVKSIGKSKFSKIKDSITI